MNKTHGMSFSVAEGRKQTPIYRVWANIKQRCTNPNNPRYADYGGRGITMCKRWLNSFENFYADVGDKPDGLTLDRINNNRGYSPNNVRWVEHVTQSRNRNYCKLDEAKAEAIRQDPRSSRVVAKEYGVDPTTVQNIRSGKSWKKGS